MAIISASACRAQLRHHDRQEVVTYSALLVPMLPNDQAQPFSALGLVVSNVCFRGRRRLDNLNTIQDKNQISSADLENELSEYG